MGNSGIVRYLDPLGRIVIPKEIRDLLCFGKDDPIEIIKINNTVILRKYKEGCIFCGNEKEVVKFEGEGVCLKFRRKLGKSWNK